MTFDPRGRSVLWYNHNIIDILRKVHVYYKINIPEMARFQEAAHELTGATSEAMRLCLGLAKDLLVRNARTITTSPP